MNMYHSKKELENAVRDQITTRDQQAIKAMLRIYEHQTDSEQCTGTTHELNGVGFAGTDSVILSSFCKQYQERGFLSPKQIAIVKRKIGKYAHQIVEHAIANGVYVKNGPYWVTSK